MFVHKHIFLGIKKNKIEGAIEGLLLITETKYLFK